MQGTPLQSSSSWPGRLIAVALAAVLLTLAPFAAALEIHHELAAADQDGHEHSDTDLCQWVQHHTGSSLSIAAPVATACVAPASFHFPEPAALTSGRFVSSSSSRAPPVI